AQCFEDCDDFMLGNAVLVAPVVEQGATTRTLYLPKAGTDWFDFYDGTRFTAGQWHTVNAPLGRLPLFVQGGVPIALEGRTLLY
ncbi:MAG: hypothetical protein RJB60_1234, partial [Pseudomonadota bacterium]